MFDRFTLHHLCPCVYLTLVRHAINEPIRVVIVLAILRHLWNQFGAIWNFRAGRLGCWKTLAPIDSVTIICLSPYLPWHNLCQSSPGRPSHLIRGNQPPCGIHLGRKIIRGSTGLSVSLSLGRMEITMFSLACIRPYNILSAHLKSITQLFSPYGFLGRHYLHFPYRWPIIQPRLFATISSCFLNYLDDGSHLLRSSHPKGQQKAF